MNKAVVFVDVQKDFIDGTLRNEKAIEVTPNIVNFAKECVEKGYKLYATRDTHEKTTYCRRLFDNEPDIPKSGYLATLEGCYLPVEHCIEGTDGWMIDECLIDVIYGNCTFINKPTFGSFDLAEIIAEDFKNTALDKIILVGFCTDICVVSNALILRAKFPNKNITVMQNLCAGTTDKNHDAALDVMRSCQIDVV